MSIQTPALMIERETQGGAFRSLEFTPREVGESASTLIYLHGSGERGEDLSLVKRYGLPALLASGSACTNCTVICPQLEPGQEWLPDRLFEFIAATKERYSQVALVGYSLGGHGVCEVVGQYGPVASLAVAFAGRKRSRATASQAGVTFLSIQGELDVWPRMAGFVQSVSALGGTAHEVTLPGQGHYIAEQALWHPLLQALLHASGFKIQPQAHAG